MPQVIKFEYHFLQADLPPSGAKIRDYLSHVNIDEDKTLIAKNVQGVQECFWGMEWIHNRGGLSLD